MLRLAPLILVLAVAPAAASPLPPPVLEALQRAGIPPNDVAAVVQEVDARRPSLQARADVPMKPASVMKVITTYAALELLGPDYRWPTEVYADGPLHDGVLEGNLVLKGSGDPRLNYEALWLLLRNLRGKGLREIRGDVVLDRSAFGPAPGDPGAFDGERYRPYNVLPDALLVNFKSLRFAFVPQPRRGSVRVYAEPDPPGFTIVNSLKLAAGECPQGRAFRDLIGAAFDGEPPAHASFTGRYPASCGERHLYVSLLSPENYLAGIVRELWTEMGGSWTGRVRDGLAPPGALPLHVHESPPLAEIIRDINKFSNNVMARQLYLTLAVQAAGSPARPEAAEQAIRRWLSEKHIAAPELVMDNGSGLSRRARVSAGTLARVLLAAWRSPLMPEFVASLPLVAVDGTMHKYMLDAPVAGNAHLKDGLLSNARAIAGYVHDRSGREQVVVMIVNHPNAEAAEPAVEAMVSWVYARGRARATWHPRDVLSRAP